MTLFRNILKEFLFIFPAKDIYKDLEEIGNYGTWRKNLIQLLGTEKYKHPLTIVLFQRKSSRQICNAMERRFKKMTIPDKPWQHYRFANWLLVHQYKYN